MNEIYAIDPCAPQDIKDVVAMLNRFGMSNGIFIANYPKDWFVSLCEHVSEIGSLDRSRLSLMISNNMDSLLDVESEYKKVRTWDENVENLKMFSKVIAYVLASSPNSRGFPTLESFLWGLGDNKAGAARGSHIPMTAKSYMEAIRPLLLKSTEVHLADSYFKLRDDYGQIDRRKSELLISMLSAADDSRRCERIFIHFKRLVEYSEDAQEVQCIKDFDFIRSKAKKIECDIQFDLHDEMTHGRYIFSIKGGLQFDHGFLINPSKKNHVHWLSKSELLPIQSFYNL